MTQNKPIEHWIKEIGRFGDDTYVARIASEVKEQFSRSGIPTTDLSLFDFLSAYRKECGDMEDYDTIACPTGDVLLLGGVESILSKMGKFFTFSDKSQRIYIDKRRTLKLALPGLGRGTLWLIGRVYSPHNFPDNWQVGDFYRVLPKGVGYMIWDGRDGKVKQVESETL